MITIVTHNEAVLIADDVIILLAVVEDVEETPAPFIALLDDVRGPKLTIVIPVADSDVE